MGSWPGDWNVFSYHLLLKGSQVSPKIICSYTVAGCYAAWNNNCSGREEATLCIAKWRHWDLVSLKCHEIFSVLVATIKLKYVAGKHLDLYTGAIHP